MIVETFFSAERMRAYGTLFLQDHFWGRALGWAGCRFVADSYKGSAGYFVLGGHLGGGLSRAR
jgi:hypothetical protein